MWPHGCLPCGSGYLRRPLHRLSGRQAAAAAAAEDDALHRNSHFNNESLHLCSGSRWELASACLYPYILSQLVFTRLSSAELWGVFLIIPLWPNTIISLHIKTSPSMASFLLLDLGLKLSLGLLQTWPFFLLSLFWFTLQFEGPQPSVTLSTTQRATLTWRPSVGRYALCTC